MKTFAVAMTLAGLVACSGTDHHPDRPPSTVTFDGSNAVLYVDVAGTAPEQQRGLMGLEVLPADEGMAFVFTEPVNSTFWMKDTLIPLSIAFYDDRGRIVSLLDMEPCRVEPCPLYSPGAAYRGALEVNRGAFDRWGVRVGDRLRLEQ